MNRRVKLAMAVIGLFGLTAAAAFAAATPAVSTGPASSITDSSAVLHGTVNPGGSKTGYFFQWGVSTAYGSTSKPRVAGSGTKTVPVKLSVHGLLPGTPYHYRVGAFSKIGSALGPDHTFKTKGNPPPTPTTGAVSQVSANSATITGLVNPNHVETRWYVQYGLTTAYGLQTGSQTIPAGATPVPVSAQLQGLQSGTIFHYRIVAVNRGITEAGNDAMFMTYPQPAPSPRLSAKTRPGRDRSRPYEFTTSGRLHHPSSIPSLYACSAQVRVRFFFGNRRIGQKTTSVQADCSFSTQSVFRHLPKHHTGRSARLKVVVRFLGNGYLAAKTASNEHVSEG
jgi:hypothetical protein